MGENTTCMHVGGGWWVWGGDYPWLRLAEGRLTCHACSPKRSSLASLGQDMRTGIDGIDGIDGDSRHLSWPLRKDAGGHIVKTRPPPPPPPPPPPSSPSTRLEVKVIRDYRHGQSVSPTLRQP